MSINNKPVSFREFGIQVQVESIRDIIGQIKLVESMPLELLGGDRLSMLTDMRGRLVTLFETLDWGTLDVLLQEHCKHENEWRKVS